MQSEASVSMGESFGERSMSLSPMWQILQTFGRSFRLPPQECSE
jgi:hypothetical protein